MVNVDLHNFFVNYLCKKESRPDIACPAAGVLFFHFFQTVDERAVGAAELGSGLLEPVHIDGALLHRGDGAGAGHAAAGAGHALQQIAVPLSGLGHHQHLLALPQAVAVLDLHLAVGIDVADGLHHGSGHAAAHGKATAHAGALAHVVCGISLDGGKVDLLGVEHALELLKGENVVHVGADGLAVCLQLLGGAGADEADPGVGVVLFHHAGGDDHGGQGHGDIVLELGEELLGHHRPGGAAGRAHEGLLGRDVLQEVMGLLHGAKVRADGHFHHVGEAQDAHGGLELCGGGLLAELAHEGGGHAGDDLIVALHGVDDLEDLALVGNGGEGAVHQAHAAGDALVVVDLGPAQLVGFDGVHAAGCGAGALNLADGVVGALVEAPAAFDALVLVNVAMRVLVQINGILGAHIHAGMGQAALAAVRNPDLLGGAGIAGKGDDIDQGMKGGVYRMLTVNDIGRFKSGIQEYRSTAGEVEARNVESRLDFTSAQRRNTLAVSTEDIARNGQIFLSRDVRMDELARHVSFLAGKLHIPVEVIRHADEAGSPDIRGLLSCGKDIRGWYDIPSQRVCLYLPHARGKADVERTLLHEGVAHYGLRKLAGHKHMDAFLDDIFNGCGEKVRDEILRMAAADKTDIRVATEEYLARMAEAGTDQSLWDRIVTAFRNLLRKLGFCLEIGTRELRGILAASRKNLTGIAEPTVIQTARGDLELSCGYGRAVLRRQGVETDATSLLERMRKAGISPASLGQEDWKAVFNGGIILPGGRKLMAVREPAGYGMRISGVSPGSTRESGMEM